MGLLRYGSAERGLELALQQEVSDDKHSTWPRITLTLPFAMVMSIAAMAEAEERSMDDFILSCRPGAKRKLTGQEEALLVATACSRPPEGRAPGPSNCSARWCASPSTIASRAKPCAGASGSRCSSLPL